MVNEARGGAMSHLCAHQKWLNPDQIMTKIDYARLGKQHARKALKEFFAEAPSLHKKECEHDDSICDECLTQKAFDTFYNMQLRDATNPNANFTYPQMVDDEKAYNDAAMELITNTVKNMPRSGGSPDYITDPEDAYNLGSDTMNEVIQEVLKFILPDDLTSSDLKKTLIDKAWNLFSAKLENNQIHMPRIHGLLKQNYDKGIHDALVKMEVPKHAPVTASIFHAPKRAARYEKLLMSIHN